MSFLSDVSVVVYSNRENGSRKSEVFLLKEVMKPIKYLGASQLQLVIRLSCNSIIPLV